MRDKCLRVFKALVTLTYIPSYRPFDSMNKRWSSIFCLSLTGSTSTGELFSLFLDDDLSSKFIPILIDTID